MAFELSNDHLEARIKELAVMKLQTLDRVQKAEQELKAAKDSLILINGAMQDCDFWRGEITKQSLSQLPQLTGTFEKPNGVRYGCQNTIKLEEDSTAHGTPVRK